MIIHMSRSIILVQLKSHSVLELNSFLSNKPAWDNELTHYTNSECACLEQEPPNNLIEKYYKSKPRS